ncbi:MAG: ParB/RepB/Spo0J family partition protein [Oscillospiraceae bacterium]|nr:ParB/RepB/Spo0J family partition protein [Oscillospiraceae bacterium]
MSAAKKGLGRGLGALIEDFAPPVREQSITSLPLQRVEPNPNQPRRSFDEAELQALADSITEHGILQPLAVRAMESGYYQIIAGERRWRAARLAGLSEVPVVVLEADDKTVMELALVENLQRQDLNPMEEAEGYRTLMEDYAMTQEQAAQRVGKSRPAVANALRLLALPDEVRQMVEEGAISAGHARAVLSLPNEKLQKAAAQKIIALRLSVRQAEAMCKAMASHKPEQQKKPVGVDYVAECEKTLSKQLGRRVKIVSGKRKGRFELEFYDQDDLQQLYEALLSLRKNH